MGGMYRHYSVMHAAWSVVQCSSSALLFRASIFSPDMCAAGVANQRTDVLAQVVGFFVCSCCLNVEPRRHRL